MKVYLIRRKNPRPATSCCTAFQSKGGAEGRLSQSNYRFLTDSVQRHGKSYAGGSFSFTCRGRSNCRYEDQFPIFTIFKAFQESVVYLRYVVAVRIENVVFQSQLIGDLFDRFQNYHLQSSNFSFGACSLAILSSIPLTNFPLFSVPYLLAISMASSMVTSMGMSFSKSSS